jgi:hypothetical protein
MFYVKKAISSINKLLELVANPLSITKILEKIEAGQGNLSIQTLWPILVASKVTQFFIIAFLFFNDTFRLKKVEGNKITDVNII